MRINLPTKYVGEFYGKDMATIQKIVEEALDDYFAKNDSVVASSATDDLHKSFIINSLLSIMDKMDKLEAEGVKVPTVVESNAQPMQNQTTPQSFEVEIDASELGDSDVTQEDFEDFLLGIMK